jgi:hypothetical protein
MPTEAQIDANRGNALHSTGPRTVEGKSVSSANATKHGLAGSFRVLPHESQDEFDELLAGYHRTFVPATPHEQFLVEEIAQSRWRLARIRRIETAAIQQMLDAAGSSDGDAVLAAALLDNTAGAFKTLQRYAAAAERSYYRALKQLQDARPQDAAPTEKPKLRNEPNFTAVSPEHPADKRTCPPPEDPPSPIRVSEPNNRQAP